MTTAVSPWRKRSRTAWGKNPALSMTTAVSPWRKRSRTAWGKNPALSMTTAVSPWRKPPHRLGVGSSRLLLNEPSPEDLRLEHLHHVNTPGSAKLI